MTAKFPTVTVKTIFNATDYVLPKCYRYPIGRDDTREDAKTLYDVRGTSDSFVEYRNKGSYLLLIAQRGVAV